jgi:hypothetical protein
LGPPSLSFIAPQCRGLGDIAQYFYVTGDTEITVRIDVGEGKTHVRRVFDLVVFGATAALVFTVCGLSARSNIPDCSV